MVSTSKILTVSYGTFSCTLEGFDEPFNTMKSIAEYFRDLAADDRYFGAEPPTPDAEMLHRIAEREIQKRVEARIENDEVVLRQADAAAPRIKPAAATLIPGETLLDDKDGTDDAAQAPVAPVEEAEAPAARPVSASVTETVTETVAEPVEAPASDLPADSIAAKLQRIRAVVDRGHDAADEYVEDQQAQPFFEEAELADGPADIPVEEPAEEPVAQHAPAPLMFAETEFADPAPHEAGEIEEPVAVQEDEAEEEDFETETEAEDLAAEVEDVDDGAPEAHDVDDADDTDALAAVMGAMAAKAPADDGYDEDEFEIVDELAEEDDPIGSVLAGLAAENTAEDTAEADDVEAEDEPVSDALREDWDIALGDDLDDGHEDAGELARDDEDDKDENVFAEAEEAQTEEPEETPEPVRLRRPVARVIKVKRADFTPVAEDEVQDNEDSMLSPEDEADLMAELAQVERDFADPEGEAPEAAPVAPVTEEPGFAESDAAVDRILAETNVKMDSSDVSRRRSAIAHLKAAVQATRADEEAGDATPSQDETEAYRDDLARVVRPRRPGGVGAKGAPRRLAPLMLVSEQRIDTPSPEQAMPAAAVRPRRVTKGNLALDEEREEEVMAVAPVTPTAALMDSAIDFDSFARQKGASDMGELLECAAAHAVFIEGRPHFSRPQIMKLALSHDPEAGHSREEGLRAFGKLLREGRIRKLKRGQFVLNEATRFHPDEGRESA